MLTSQRGIGCRLEGGENVFVFSLDMLLNSLEISTGELMREPKKRLVLHENAPLV